MTGRRGLSFIWASVALFISQASGSSEVNIDEQMRQLVPFELTSPDLGTLTENDKGVIEHLTAAAKIINQIYVDQMGSSYTYLRTELVALVEKNPANKPYLDYFDLAAGPYDIFQGKWFLPMFPEIKRSEGANFYPADMTAKELNDYVVKFPQAKKALWSPYTMVRRNVKKGSIYAIPYSVYYRDSLTKVAKHLRAAKSLASDPQLQKLLESRAEALLTDRYNETEIDWIDSWDSTIQLTLGPYEEYEDNVLGTKRGFQAQVSLKDAKATANLQRSKDHLRSFQERLPIDPKYLKDKQSRTEITAINELYLGGMSSVGIKAMAHKLPNDREVIVRDGSRRVLFMNVIQGKCENVLKPISKIVLAPELQPYVTCDAFEKFALNHELAHALGPAFYYEDINKRTGRKEFSEQLGPLDSPLEEAKADITGMFDQQYLIENGIEKTPDYEKQMYTTYIVGIFRSVRFGARSAHAKGIMLQFNRLKDSGAIVFNEQGRVGFDLEKMRTHIKDVVKEILELQVAGNQEAVKDTLDKAGVVPAEMATLLDEVKEAGIPRDLNTKYTAIDRLLADVDQD